MAQVDTVIKDQNMILDEKEWGALTHLGFVDRCGSIKILCFDCRSREASLS